MTCCKCDPIDGNPDTYCADHLVAEIHHDPTRTLTPSERAIELVRASIPLRYQDVPASDLLPSLALVDPATTNVILTGPAGRGKTHQAAALVRSTIERDSDLGGPHVGRYTFANAPTLLERIRAAMKTSNAHLITDALTTSKVLVLDDLGAEKPSEWVRERVYDIVNRRYEAGRGTIVTTNLTAAQLAERLGERITGRILHGATYINLTGDQHRQPTTITTEVAS